MLRTILDAASGTAPTPTDDELHADLSAHGVEPLFDGATLERI
jgi:hypothetical protein